MTLKQISCEGESFTLNTEEWGWRLNYFETGVFFFSWQMGEGLGHQGQVIFLLTDVKINIIYCGI